MRGVLGVGGLGVGQLKMGRAVPQAGGMGMEHKYISKGCDIEDLETYLEELWDEYFHGLNPQGRLAVERVQKWVGAQKHKDAKHDRG